MKISLLKTSRNNFFLNKNLNKTECESYIFLGKDPLLSDYLDKILCHKIKKIEYLKDFVKIQYLYRDNYIDFIDLNEKADFDNQWWKTRLSGKNPWISSTYFRFCQIVLIKNILKKFKKTELNLLILIEEDCVLRSVNELLKNNYRYKFYNKRHSDFSKLKLIFTGLVRRILAIPLYLYKSIVYKIIFKSFNHTSFFNNNVFVFSFIDSRCFNDNNFNDPFLGKFLTKINIKKNISYIPVLINVSIKRLLLFRKWLSINNYSVSFLPYYISIPNALFEIFKFNFFFKKVENKYLHGINLKYLISRERLEEWSDFSLQNNLITKLSTQIKKYSHNKLLIYPFENQIWERNMLSVFEQDVNVKIYAVQNAPAPKLSIRFYVSKKMIKFLPLPDAIFVTGNISYNNLVEFYGDKILKKFSTSRKILNSQYNSNTDSIRQNIMVACSISNTESVELILFVINTLRSYNNFNVTIVSHPLSNFNFINFLQKIKAPSHIKLGKDYKNTIENSRYILFDSSTSGIEGLLNGLVPVRVVNKFSLHVNPSEYDSSYTKCVYNPGELISVLSSDIEFDNNYKEIALNYYEVDDSNELKRTISELNFLNND